MDKIKRGSTKVNAECLEVQIERVRQDGTSWTETVRITPEEAIKMTDDSVAYDLKNQTRQFKPKYIEDFNFLLSTYVRAMYEDYCLFTPKEYCDFCLARLDTDIKRRFPQPSGQLLYFDPDTGELHPETFTYALEALKKRVVFCHYFFIHCFPNKVVEKYEKDLWKMLTAHADTNDQKHPLYIGKVGGHNIGFYTDDLYRTRPLTSRKEKVIEVPPDIILKRFRTAAEEELKEFAD